MSKSIAARYVTTKRKKQLITKYAQPLIRKGKEMFTRQHYKAIAEIISSVTLMAMEPKGGTIGTAEARENLKSGVEIAQCQISRDLADYFAGDNEHFNRQKFLEACGTES